MNNSPILTKTDTSYKFRKHAFDDHPADPRGYCGDQRRDGEQLSKQSTRTIKPECAGSTRKTNSNAARQEISAEGQCHLQEDEYDAHAGRDHRDEYEGQNATRHLQGDETNLEDDGVV